MSLATVYAEHFISGMKTFILLFRPIEIASRPLGMFCGIVPPKVGRLIVVESLQIWTLLCAHRSPTLTKRLTLPCRPPPPRQARPLPVRARRAVSPLPEAPMHGVHAWYRRVKPSTYLPIYMQPSRVAHSVLPPTRCTAGQRSRRPACHSSRSQAAHSSGRRLGLLTCPCTTWAPLRRLLCTPTRAMIESRASR